jgi:hypothetical protein
MVFTVCLLLELIAEQNSMSFTTLSMTLVRKKDKNVSFTPDSRHEIILAAIGN